MSDVYWPDCFDIHVNHKPYETFFHDECPEYEDTPTFGNVRYKDCRINIWRRDPVRTLETWWHEIKHCLDYEAPGKAFMTENDVRRLSSLEIAFLIENPDFFDAMVDVIRTAQKDMATRT